MKLTLSVISFAGAGVEGSNKITLNQEGASLGRKDDNALVLPDTKRYVSGHHALIEYRSPHYFITDTSANGVLINNSKTPLGKGNSQKLNDKDHLTIGDYLIEVKLEDDFFEANSLAIPPLSDAQFNFPDDPFAGLDTDSIQGMIDKNDLIPSDWSNSREKSNDPFEFPDSPIHERIPDKKIDSSRGDYDHIPPYKEAFPVFQKETKRLTDIEPATGIPPDIFSEDWYRTGNDIKKDESQPTTAADIKPQFQTETKPAIHEPLPFELESATNEIHVPENIFTTEEIKKLTDIEPSLANPDDIFSEDWYSGGNDSKKVKSHPTTTADIKPQFIKKDTKSEKLEPLPVEPEAAKEEIPATEKIVTASSFEEELIQNFLRGAQLEPAKFRESINPETFFIIGTILRAAIQGTMDVLIGRAKIKNEMHLDVTIIRSKQNNPIKFSVSTDEALSKLLLHKNTGYLPPKEAVEEAFDDIRAHQYSVIAGMQASLLTVLKRFDPQKLEERLQRLSPISASIPIHKQAKLWNLFEQLYEEIQQEAEDNFYHLFGQAFAKTYEQQMQKLKSSKKDNTFK
ncbi:MAG: type VI secretion system-associated FHA domain protein TagH [Methylococcales bacterium]|nr:type VI secretion system-associated FHA domain protein TagH [Methylococcales bacterium]